jgi:hypothetical protein
MSPKKLKEMVLAEAINKIKLRATITWTYLADPNHYGIDDPNKMAAIDQEQDDMEAILDMGMNQKDFTFTVKPEVE